MYESITDALISLISNNNTIKIALKLAVIVIASVVTNAEIAQSNGIM